MMKTKCMSKKCYVYMMINNLIDKQMFCRKIPGAYWIYYEVVAIKIDLVIKHNVDDTS